MIETGTHVTGTETHVTEIRPRATDRIPGNVYLLEIVIYPPESPESLEIGICFLEGIGI